MLEKGPSNGQSSVERMVAKRDWQRPLLKLLNTIEQYDADWAETAFVSFRFNTLRKSYLETC